MSRIERGLELTPEVPIEELADLAGQAEHAGFDAVLTSSHYFNRDPFIALGRIADTTTEIWLGPAVVNPYESHPVSLAARAATIQEESDGRAVFGIGAGDASTLRALDIERDRPLGRVLESLRIARRLWAGESVEEGDLVGVSGAALNFEVDALPVYVGAQGPDMLQMAATHADGVLFNAAHPLEVSWAADRIEAGLSNRNPERGSFEFIVQASVSIATEVESARETARQAAAFIAAGAATPVLERHDIDPDLAAEIGDLLQGGEFQPAFEQVSPAMIDAFCVAGDPDDVAMRFESLLDTADGVVAATPLGPDRATAIELLSEAIPS